MQNKHNLLWVDLEMTGLNPHVHKILEASIIPTDLNLQPLHKGVDLIIHQPLDSIEIDEWSLKHHGKSGLLSKVKESNISLRQAEIQLIEVAKTYCIKGIALLAGNSIHQDRAFLKVQMPEFEEFLSYRNLDISSIKELAFRWYPSLPLFVKQNKHRALDDIFESIAELKYYHNFIFKNPADFKKL